MKLIHIVSSVALFCLPALAVNDWDCGEVVIKAHYLEEWINYFVEVCENRDQGAYEEFPPDHFFTVERPGRDANLPRS
ncbi:BgTH12-05473 [Blumeria graminis f. sp. triticale]|uniref:BgTH12-05473 n=1 Tax=Blumeria graminis f. sp. triticale TaxID=1689686 RepID=A0A9W4D3Z0_BLUGR|nr:BgTH12-05473 [Blumeria graminis f. sp. triticale]